MSVFFVGRGFPDWCSLPQIPKDEDEIDDTNNRPDWCPLEEVPETHEERTETHACDCIERQAAIEAIEEMQMPIMRYMFPEEQFVFKGMSEALSAIKDLPSAQPEQTNSWCINSWCIGCKEYDQERKCCPRYNRVIRQTLDEAYAHGETEAEARFHNEIVWCKDCKYYREYGYVNGKPKFLPKCTFNSIYVNADDFCSRAERRTDDLQ